jgi:2-isopropylmalate synthase
VHPRHPYAGQLVYTAFSGSHQDAIKKGFAALDPAYDVWGVPYLPIDPAHVGRTYEAVIRVNSQSGKGGVAWVMESEHGFALPRRMQMEFSKCVQAHSELNGGEVSPAAMWELFQDQYLQEPSMKLVGHEISRGADGRTRLVAHIDHAGRVRTVSGDGNGPIDAFVHGIKREFGELLEVLDYHEHAIGTGSHAGAVAYVEVIDDERQVRWGVGQDHSTLTASLMAVLAVLGAKQRA